MRSDLLNIKSELNITISVFPNPINEKLILHILDFNFEILTYHLYDVQGKQIIKEEIRSQTTILDIGELPSSVYFIDFLNPQNKKIQSFKIIKN